MTTTRTCNFKPIIVLQVVNNGDGTYRVIDSPNGATTHRTFTSALQAVAHWLDIETSSVIDSRPLKSAGLPQVEMHLPGGTE